MMTLDKRDFGRHLTLVPGEEVLVELDENATTGFSWTAEGYAADSLALADTRFIAPSTTAVGAAGKRHFRFQARAAGVSRLEFRLTCPWLAAAPPAETGILTITVNP